MNVKQGDLVTINGIQSSVETSWGQGKHKIFKLSDGRLITDLDKSVEAGHVKIDSIPESKLEIPMPPVKEPKKWNL